MSENIIKIDTGVVTKTFVTTDGKECEFAFNPLDMGLSRRLFSAFEKLDKMNEGYKDEVQKNADKKGIFDCQLINIPLIINFSCCLLGRNFLILYSITLESHKMDEFGNCYDYFFIKLILFKNSYLYG